MVNVYKLMARRRHWERKETNFYCDQLPTSHRKVELPYSQGRDETIIKIFLGLASSIFPLSFVLLLKYF